MADAYKPTPGLKRSFFDPCLVMRPQQGSTMGEVIQKGEGDPFDDLVIKFRGKILQAKAAHPEISVGQLVNVFEWPEGMFWGTCLQPSWYLQPLEDLIKAGRKSQAAMNYIMRKNPKYWPALIRIDKRGQEDPGGDDGSGGDGGDDGSGDENTQDWNDPNGDGFMDYDEWIEAGLDPDDFSKFDTNGDGKISRLELFARGETLPAGYLPYTGAKWAMYVERPNNGSLFVLDALVTEDGLKRLYTAGYLSSLPEALPPNNDAINDSADAIISGFFGSQAVSGGRKRYFLKGYPPVAPAASSITKIYLMHDTPYLVDVMLSTIDPTLNPGLEAEYAANKAAISAAVSSQVSALNGQNHIVSYIDEHKVSSYRLTYSMIEQETVRSDGYKFTSYYINTALLAPVA